MKSFEELGLNEDLLKAIGELGFENPMPIQEEVIPYILGGGNDLVALAQTGTGKTAAFGLPVLQHTDLASKATQTLILCPTRELCIQIADDITDYAKYLSGFHILPVYGGSSIRNQIMSLKKGVQVIVATPGRLIDLMERGEVDLSTVTTVVMDEADEMLDMGFIDDIEKILGSVPDGHKTMLFSATMPAEVEKIASKFMIDPHEIVIGRKNESTASVRHILYTVQAKDKYRTLKRVVDYYPRIYGIIFCRTKMECQEVSDKLIRDGYNVDALHGDLSQQQRDYVMNRFRLHNIQLLVATDVAARGIDVDDLTHVINYTLPDDDEVYTHRSGRTGRAGRTGISIAIINLRETKRIKAIEKLTGKTFETGQIPTGKEICSKQIFSLIDRIEKTEVNEEQIAEILPSVFRKLDWMDKEDLVKRLVALEFNRLIEYYKDDEDFAAEDGVPKPKRVEVTREEGFTKIFITLGKMDGVMPKDLMGIVNKCVEGKVEIGRIDLFTRYSLFDVKSERAQEVIQQMDGLNCNGRSVKVSIATDEQIDRGTKDRKEGKDGGSRRRRKERGEKSERPEKSDRRDRFGRKKRH